MGAGGFQLASEVVVVSDGATLPAICIKTGERGTHARTEKMSWSPLWSWMILGWVGAWLTSQDVTITYYLSDKAERDRRRSSSLLAASFMVGLAALVVAIFADQPAIGIVVVSIALVGVAVSARLWSGVRIKKVEDGKLHMKLGAPALRAFSDHVQTGGGR